MSASGQGFVLNGLLRLRRYGLSQPLVKEAYNEAGADVVADLLFGAAAPPGAYVADITPATYTTTASAIAANVGRLAGTTPATYTTTASSIAANVGRLADITPASYTTTPVSIAANVGRLADITPASYATTPASITVLRGFRADVTPAAYSASFSTITVTYSGLPPVALGAWLPFPARRRRR